MKKGAPHPVSKPPVPKVQHSDTYKVSQYGSEKMNVVLFYTGSDKSSLPQGQKIVPVLIVVKSSNDIKTKYHPSLAF